MVSDKRDLKRFCAASRTLYNSPIPELYRTAAIGVMDDYEFISGVRAIRAGIVYCTTNAWSSSYLCDYEGYQGIPFERRL